MLEKARRSLQWLLSKTDDQSHGSEQGREAMKILRKGPAMRVIFFYPGEEGTYVDHSEVILYENGIVHINSNQEETTTHLQNCEILWRFETDAEDRANKVRLLKPKAAESRVVEEPAATSKSDSKEGKSGKGHHHSSKKNPELVE
jgi:hypothetical protein